MAARKKKPPARKAARTKAPAKTRVPRALPNDDAWRALVATAVEQRESAADGRSSGAAAKPAARKKATKK